MKEAILFLSTLFAWYCLFLGFVWLTLKLFFPLYTKEEIERRKARFLAKQMEKKSRDQRRVIHQLVLKNH